MLILKRLEETEGKWESRGVKVIIETERDQGPRHPSETRNKGLIMYFLWSFLYLRCCFREGRVKLIE